MLEKYRRLLRSDLTAWCIEALSPFGQKPAEHHLVMIRELEALARGENDRLMLFLPPGSAKSTYASVLFAAWFMAQAPGMCVIGASNTATLAETFSKRVQSMVREYAATLGFSLRTESAELWHTSNGGQYRAAGVGGVVTGFRADLAVIDDPIRGREDADSETIREKTWNWYRADLTTRLKPSGRIVLVQTRWHEDDLAGRLLSVEGERWRVVSLPAQAVADDPLGRAVGDWLWSDDDYGYGALLRTTRDDFERAGAMRDWSALYQQDPRPMEGLLFQVAHFSQHAGAIEPGQTVRAWDLAATEQVGARDPDWTVGVKMHRDKAGKFYVMDVKRERFPPEKVEALIVQTAQADGPSVGISLPEDPGQAGKAQVLYLTRKLAGFRVESTRETGDKSTRAAPYASQVNVGNVALLPGLWNRAYTEELRGFPAGTKDDQVDASSRAFNYLTAVPPPARQVRVNLMGR